MKQIYTLLAAAFISTAAFAGVDRNVRYEATKLKHVDAKELIAKKGVPLENSILNGMQRIVNQDDNSTWTTLVAIQDKLTNIYGFENKETGKPLEFVDYPYYDMIIALQPMSQGAKGFYPLEVLWPAYGALDDDLYDENGALNVEKCKERYGEKALEPYSYEDFIKDMTAQQVPTILFTMPGFYQRPCILGPEALYQDGIFRGMQCENSDGQKCYLKSSELIKEGEGYKIDYSQATTLDWTNFDLDSSAVEMIFSGKLTSTVGGAVTSTASADLKGEAVILGFKDIFWDTIGEVHIFNAGPQKYGDEWTWNYDNAFEGTLNYYYLAMCDETVTYQGTTTAGEELCCYSDKDLPTNGAGVYGAPAYPMAEEQHYIYFAGALWAPENAQPYGKWEMKAPEIIRDNEGNAAYKQIPEAYNLVVYSNASDGTQDGFHGAYEGYLQVAVPEKTFIGIGDKKYGVNFRITTAMNYGHAIYGSFTDDIMLHNTPNKWQSDITTLPAISDIDADFVGIESVVEESNAPVVSRSFYNFQGQRLSSEPESGMYIIRSVKADGTVKAEKVAK